MSYMPFKTHDAGHLRASRFSKSSPGSQRALRRFSQRLMLLVAVFVPLGVGCALPLSTAAPQSATTVGKGHGGVVAYAETPVVDLLANQQTPKDKVFADVHTATIQASIGLSDDLDLEMSADGVFYVVPVPLGGSVGARYQVARTKHVDIALAGRVGAISTGFSDSGASDDSCTSACAYAIYGAVTTAAQLQGRGWFKPIVSFSALPARVINKEAVTEAKGKFNALAISATLGLTIDLGRIEVTPFLNAATVRIASAGDPGTIVGGGIAFAIRGLRGFTSARQSQQ